MIAEAIAGLRSDRPWQGREVQDVLCLRGLCRGGRSLPKELRRLGTRMTCILPSTLHLALPEESGTPHPIQF